MKFYGCDTSNATMLFFFIAFCVRNQTVEKRKAMKSSYLLNFFFLGLFEFKAKAKYNYKFLRIHWLTEFSAN